MCVPIRTGGLLIQLNEPVKVIKALWQWGRKVDYIDNNSLNPHKGWKPRYGSQKTLHLRNGWMAARRNECLLKPGCIIFGKCWLSTPGCFWQQNNICFNPILHGKSKLRIVKVSLKSLNITVMWTKTFQICLIRQPRQLPFLIFFNATMLFEPLRNFYHLFGLPFFSPSFFCRAHAYT